MVSAKLKPGDWVIYRKQKVSSSPGPRAKNTTPASKGETYSYVVEKYWVVDELLESGELRIRTRRGKQHIVQPDDPRLRKAKWWHRLLRGDRFRAVEESTTSETKQH
tara:strand:- start:21568 stop:21888 length:321 start_codon:yes stop_codon:yes gene_type:complete